MLRRLHHEQPESFDFTPENRAWAEAQLTKYPEDRQASAIIALLWRAQEQDGWLSRPAIEYVADMLGMAHIRALEVATFYFMFQLAPVGSVAHVQVCGTTTCMICGSEDLIGVCREMIADKAHQLSADGRLSWEEVECLGACSNAPMAQIGKDFYEDLTREKLAAIITAISDGDVPVPGPQNGRYSCEPANGLTNLKDFDSGHTQYNASVSLALEQGDSIKRIDGSETPLLTPWGRQSGTEAVIADASPEAKAEVKAAAPKPATPKPAAPAPAAVADAPAEGTRPAALDAPRKGGADNLKMIKGVGPKLELQLNELGFYHFDQVAGWRDAEVSWVDQNLKGFKGRVSRDNWVEQAKILAAGGQTEFAARVKKGDVY